MTQLDKLEFEEMVMLFELVTKQNIGIAAEIHAISWRESHKSFCSKEFVEAHTTERQMRFIESEIEYGKTFYILIDTEAKGIVSIKDNLIENLYVLPSEQRKGYGTKLLLFAEQKCLSTPTLWILSNNEAAKSLYVKRGYVFTGNVKPLKNELQELEMHLMV